MNQRQQVVEMKGLIKKYGDKSVVNGVSLEIYKGECFGVLGPNGAGKTTIMKMMYGSAEITDGELYILGLNVRQNLKELKSRIGVIPQEDGLDADFNVRQNLELFASYHGIQKQIAEHRATDLLRLVRLESESETPVPSLSGGMRRRLAIARGMINHPDLIFLDEPTTGLDPQARLWIWDFLRKIKAEMGTVVLTTHYMEEAEQICDRIAIIDRGLLLALGSPKDLIQTNIGAEVVEFECKSNDQFYYTSRLKENNFKYYVIRDKIIVHLSNAQDAKKVLDLIQSYNVTLRKPSLNDVFLKLAGHDLRDEPL